MALGQNSNLITTSKVTRAALMQLSNNMIIASKVDWSYSKEFARPTEMIGDTLLVRRPVLKNVQVNNMVWSNALPFEGKSSLQVGTSFSVPLGFQDADLVLKIEDFKKRFIDQVVVSLANVMDYYVYGVVINNTANTVGQYGVAITSDTILAAKELLDALDSWKRPALAREPRPQKSETSDTSKSVLGTHSPINHDEGRIMARTAIKKAKDEGKLFEAADMMEEAFNKSPSLRQKYANQVRLWRCGISM